MEYISTLLKDIVAALKQFAAIFFAWYEGRVTERAKASQKSLEKLSEDIRENIEVNRIVKGMSEDEKNKKAYSRNVDSPSNE